MKATNSTHIVAIPPSYQDRLDNTFSSLPGLVTDAGEHAARRFLEFFTANIRNRNTREAYARAVWRFFVWCEKRGVRLSQVEPMLVAAYVEELCGAFAKPTVTPCDRRIIPSRLPPFSVPGVSNFPVAFTFSPSKFPRHKKLRADRRRRVPLLGLRDRA